MTGNFESDQLKFNKTSKTLKLILSFRNFKNQQILKSEYIKSTDFFRKLIVYIMTYNKKVTRNHHWMNFCLVLGELMYFQICKNITILTEALLNFSFQLCSNRSIPYPITKMNFDNSQMVVSRTFNLYKDRIE